MGANPPNAAAEKKDSPQTPLKRPSPLSSQSSPSPNTVHSVNELQKDNQNISDVSDDDRSDY